MDIVDTDFECSLFALLLDDGIDFSLGFFNILFAWLGMIDFIVPLIFAIAAGNKGFCNRYCGRGQLFNVLGKNVGCSRNKKAPRFLATKWF